LCINIHKEKTSILKHDVISRGIVSNFIPDPQAFYEIGVGFSLMGAYFGIIIPLTISATALTLMCLLSARNAGKPFLSCETLSYATWTHSSLFTSFPRYFCLI